MNGGDEVARLGVGVIGCGAIAGTWFDGIARARHVRALCCASREMRSARYMAAQRGLEAVEVSALLEREDVGIALILTPPDSHADLAERALRAGKHVYLEKPVTPTADEARRLGTLARERGLRIGCAPDTFLGAAHQAARAVIDETGLGTITGGSLMLGDAGPDARLARPEPLFAAGMGPVRDMAPYYLTQLVCLLGAVAGVEGRAVSGPAVRTIASGPRAGMRFPVCVPTTWEGELDMVSGTRIGFEFSWDRPSAHKSISLHGTHASLRLPNPNWFGGDVLVVDDVRGARPLDLSGRAYGAANHTLSDGMRVSDYRGAGLDDMAGAILNGHEHRTNLDLAIHVTEIVEAIFESAASGRRRNVASGCARPAPLDPIR